MDLRRARAQDWLMGGLGALLVASLFLPWYSACGVRSTEVGPAAGGVLRCPGGLEAPADPISGWSAFAVTDVILAATGAVAVVALLLTVIQRTPALPLALASLATPLAIVASVLVVVRLMAPPGTVEAVAGGSAWRLAGAWIGAAATLGLLASILASIRDERQPAPAWTLAEQADAVRTLSLSDRGEGSPADAGHPPARGAT